MDDCEKDKMEIETTEKEDADDSLVTMVDVLQEQEAFEENANAVLGASDEKHCTFLKGYVKRQALYACLTCCPESKTDASKHAGVCLACSLACHENHELIELYTKRNFRCDCGTPKLPSPCQFAPQKRDLNKDNVYNQNFCGLYCECHRPYPDPEFPTNDEMIQCIICEDWWHSTHLDAKVPSNDQYSEMICKLCMTRNGFLHDYSIYSVKGNDLNDTEENIDVHAPLNGTAEDDSETKMLDSDAINGTVGDNSKTEKLDSFTIDGAPSTDDVPVVETALYNKAGGLSEMDMLDSPTVDDEKSPMEDLPVFEAALDSTAGAERNLGIEILEPATIAKDQLTVDETDPDCIDGENSESEKLDSAMTDNEELSKDDVTDGTNLIPEKTLEDTIDKTEKGDEDICTDVPGTVDSQNIAMESANEVTKLDDEVVSTKMDTDVPIVKKNDENYLSSNEVMNTDESQIAAEPKDETEAGLEAETSDVSDHKIDSDKDFDKNDQLDNINDLNCEASTLEESLSKDSCNDTGSVSGNDNNNFTNDELPANIQSPIEGSVSETDKIIGTQGQDKDEGDMKVDKHATDTSDTGDLEPDKASEPVTSLQETKSISSEDKEINSEDKESHAETNDSNDMEFPEAERNSEETTEQKTDNPEDQKTSDLIDAKEPTPENSTNLDSCLENVSEAVEAELLSEVQPERNNEKIEESSIEQVAENIEVDQSMISREASFAKAECNENNVRKDVQNGHITNNDKDIAENMEVDKPCEEASLESNDETEGPKDMDVGKNINDSDSQNGLTTENKAETTMFISTCNDNPQQTTVNDNIKIEAMNDITTDNKEQTDQTGENEDLLDDIDNDKENKDLGDGKKIEKCKRKLSESDDTCSKKLKLDGGKGACSRPKVSAPRTKGSTFWPCSWRQRLCSCMECVSMYRLKDVLFLLDVEDTVTAYEDLGKGKNAPSHYEKGLEALSSLGHVQQINAITQYNNMKEKLLDFLKGFKDNRQVVREEDIKEFFAGMKPQRESDGVYFCR